MHVAIAHNALLPDARADEEDVLVQAALVRDALLELGHTVETVEVGEEWRPIRDRWVTRRPDVVFNLVESFAGSDRLASLAVALFEQLGLPITGSSSSALWTTNHKTLAKDRLRAAQLPTPEWLESTSEVDGPSPPWSSGQSFLLKPVGEHASLGLDESAMVRPVDRRQLRECLQSHSQRHGRPCFAEAFVAGREFNVSLLASPDGCEVLPLAEIDFSQFPPGKPRIVDYRAKWDPESFEFQNTPRRFLAADEEVALSEKLRTLATACWRVFDLGGYVRVDFRVDDGGNPWILEINTNPCLSPDAGFFAALRQAGIPFSSAIQRILDDARKKGTATAQQESQSAEKCENRLDLATGRQSESQRNSHATEENQLVWRYEVTPADAAAVRRIVDATGFFYPDEVDIAEELVLDRLRLGDASGYHFVIAERGGQVVGYASFGHIACTRHSYDLYWIAVDPACQGQGLGRLILEAAERCIAQRGGLRVYIETSNREQYQSTRGFYLRCGYTCDAVLSEFYGPGDDKVIYVKSLTE